MPEPQILRRTPIPPITTAPQPIPVTAQIRWFDEDEPMEVPAYVTEWTSNAVKITWEAATGLREDWIPAELVRRSVESPHTLRTTPPDIRHRRRYK